MISSRKRQEGKKYVTHVDWEQRDCNVLKQATKAVPELLEQDPPVPITKSSVGKRIGQYRLIKKELDKLPQTRLYLDKHCESVDDFQIRRARWAGQKLHDENETITAYLIRRRGNIPGAKKLSQRVIEETERLAEYYNEGEVIAQNSTYQEWNKPYGIYRAAYFVTNGEKAVRSHNQFYRKLMYLRHYKNTFQNTRSEGVSVVIQIQDA